jgi:hypothetical protein
MVCRRETEEGLRDGMDADSANAPIVLQIQVRDSGNGSWRSWGLTPLFPRKREPGEGVASGFPFSL